MKVKTLCLNELYSHFVMTFPGNGDIKYFYKNLSKDTLNLISNNDGYIKVISSDKATSYGGRRHNFYLAISIQDNKIKSIDRYEIEVKKEKSTQYYLAFKKNGFF